MPQNKAAPSTAPSTGFAYSREQFQQLIEDALERARKLGATDAAAEVSEGAGLSVSVRKGKLENVERNRDKTIGVTVYLGQRRGNASTSDFSSEALSRTVQAAYDIARHTAEDPAAGLPDEADLAKGKAARRDLDLFHPWAIDAEAAAELSRRCEAAALEVDPASPTPKARGCQLSNRTSGLATAGAFAVATPAHVTRCRSRPSPVAATTCSATSGTRPSATPATWPSPRPWAATPPNAPCRA